MKPLLNCAAFNQRSDTGFLVVFPGWNSASLDHLPVAAEGAARNPEPCTNPYSLSAQTVPPKAILSDPAQGLPNRYICLPKPLPIWSIVPPARPTSATTQAKAPDRLHGLRTRINID